jgi:hypothetical protein
MFISVDFPAPVLADQAEDAALPPLQRDASERVDAEEGFDSSEVWSRTARQEPAKQAGAHHVEQRRGEDHAAFTMSMWKEERFIRLSVLDRMHEEQHAENVQNTLPLPPKQACAADHVAPITSSRKVPSPKVGRPASSRAE